MSARFYGKMWIATRQELHDVVLREHVLRHLTPTKDRAQAHELIGNLFTRYIILCNNLSELYDQTLQVQRRALIEKLLTMAQERLQEVQRSVQQIEMSQFVFVDDALVELSLTPYDIEFLRPFYFPRRRSFECQQVIESAPVPAGAEPKVIDEEKKPKGLDRFRKVLTREELAEEREHERMTKIVNAIKRHEKARQARVLGVNVEFSRERVKLRTGDEEEEEEIEEIPYEFFSSDDQPGKFKIKRTKLVANLFAEIVEMRDYDYYTPPVFKLNRLGKKVLVPKVPKVKEIVKVKEVIDEEELLREAEEKRLKQLAKEEEERKAAEERARKNEAAWTIQRNFHLHTLKKKIAARDVKRRELCGMQEKPTDREVPSIRDPSEAHANKRRERKREFDAAFLKALADEKARILKMKSPVIMEDITEDIRAWFREFYDEARDFHRYPEEFEGGTIMVMYGETKTPAEFLIEKSKTPKEKKQERKAKRKAKKQEKMRVQKEKARMKVMEAKKRQLELKEGVTFDFSAVKEWSAFESLEKTLAEDTRDFAPIDVLKDRRELPIWEWVTVDTYCDVHKELRAIVDDLMRVELQLLRFALSLDLKKPYVPQKPKKPKRKKKKKQQRKTIVDIFEERSVAECFNELRELNIIREYEKKSLGDFIGDCSYATSELRSINKDPPPTYGDIKNYIQSLMFALPMQLKSLCIIGPEKCGKKFLVEALCSEMGAVMFDLSAPKIKDIADMSQFLELVLQVAVKFQPSVLFIDGAHKPFIRKADDEVKLENPWKLGKYLFKDVVRNLTSEDAVMLIGVTSEPWNCNFRYLRLCYERFAIFPPKLDFASAVKAWRTGLSMKRIHNFDAISLAEMSRGFATGDILDAIDLCVEAHRDSDSSWKPLTCNELMETLITAKRPIKESVAKQFNKFAAMLDPFIKSRTRERERAQVELDKKAAERAQREKKAKKK